MFWTQKIARGTGVQYSVNSFHLTLPTFVKETCINSTPTCDCEGIEGWEFGSNLIWFGFFHEEYIQNHINTKEQISETLVVINDNIIVKNECPIPCISSEKLSYLPSNPQINTSGL